MPSVNLGPRDFIYRAMREFRKNNPDCPFMPIGLLVEQMKVPEDKIHQMLEQLHEHGLIDLHPMWPHIREAFISEAFNLPRYETP